MKLEIKADLYYVTARADTFELEPIVDTKLDRAIQRADLAIFRKRLARSATPSAIAIRQTDQVIYKNPSAKHLVVSPTWQEMGIVGHPDLVLLQEAKRGDLGGNPHEPSLQEAVASISLSNSFTSSPNSALGSITGKLLDH